ncbi:uncharacterized protein [Physcomitrium patens]|nr:uncharacterized protein LOC112278611 [Physcomitrium patens]|eukprot:XP_024367978.1 uncharacterized protein LOC112278611 [Physcomitrella patens]
MAKLLFLVAVLVIAAAVAADAHVAPALAPAAAKAPAPTPVPAPARAPFVKKDSSFSLKCVIHNVATRDVAVKLVVRGKDAAKRVVAKSGQWTAIGPVKLGCSVPVVHVWVTVKNNRGWAVTKSFPIRLAEFLKNVVPKCTKVLALTAFEKAKARGSERCLVVKVGKKEVLTVKY